jgi:hypothetical protein
LLYHVVGGATVIVSAALGNANSRAAALWQGLLLAAALRGFYLP